EALDAQASFDKVLFDGGEFGAGGAIGSDDESDFIGIPGLLEPEQVTELLRKHQADQQTRRRHVPVPAPEQATDEFEHRALKEDRNRLQSLVGAWARRTRQPHATIHVYLTK